MASPELLAVAVQRLTSGAWHDAEMAARAVLANDANNPHASLLMGLAVAAMGEDARAAKILVQVAANHPDDQHPCQDLAQLAPPLPRGLVARQFRACLHLAPTDDRLRLAFAAYLLDTDQPAQAETILAEGPDTAARHHFLGLAQAENNQFPAAIASFRRAVECDPTAAASWSNLGMILKIEGQFDAAIAAHDQAVAFEPDNHRFRVNRAVALLKMGNWTPAWVDYESRLQLTGAPSIDPYLLLPSLGPRQTLAGKTIVALHEDGFGDTLQFLRYLPLLAEQGAKVVACVPPPLVRVMQAVPGVTAVVTDRGRLPPHDFICPMFSLPRVFATTVGAIPSVPAYAVDAALVRLWAARLPRAGLRVGLVWAGQARPSLPGFGTLDRRRSAGLEAFAPLFDLPGTAFVSLQAGLPARQIRLLGLDLFDPMPDVADFADTAAIIAGLDVVISVDTSVVHLAGLVGKPVFLLDRYDGCWRWLSVRRDSPWFPKLTIFRQHQPGDWSGAMAEVASAVRALVRDRDVVQQPASAPERISA